MSKYQLFEQEALAYKLLPGEQRFTMMRPGAVLHWSRLPARCDRPLGVLVLLHGVASNGSRWEEFAESTALREFWDIVRMDLRGHAASVCREKARIEDWCSDLEAILNELNVDRAVVIGHSLGAQVAMNFAARYPNRMRALALLDPLVDEALTPKAESMRKRIPIMRLVESVTRRMNRLGMIRKLMPQDLRAMDEQARVKIAKGGKELEEFIEQYSSTKADLQYIHLATYIRDLLEVSRSSPEPEQLNCPTLVIGSSAGTFTDEKAMGKWVERIPNGQMCSVTCAHWPMTECPDEVSQKIVAWIDASVVGKVY